MDISNPNKVQIKNQTNTKAKKMSYCDNKVELVSTTKMHNLILIFLNI